MRLSIDIPFPTELAESWSPEQSREKLFNWFIDIERRPGKSQITRRGRPGYNAPFVTFGGDIRGVLVSKDKLYVVAGIEFFSVASNGFKTTLGIITGTGNVDIETDGDSFLIRNNDGVVYLHNGFTITVASGSPVSSSLTYMDAFGIASVKDTPTFFITDVGNLNSWPVLNFANADAGPDNIVAVHGQDRSLYLLGEKTIEVWQNTGNVDFAFEPVNTVSEEIGILSGDSLAQAKSGFFFLGSDYRVYGITGYTLQVVSTLTVNRAIEDLSNQSDAIGMAFDFAGHEFYHLRFENGASFVYDITAGQWVEWSTRGESHWSPTDVVNFMGKAYAAVGSSLYALDDEAYSDNGLTIDGEIISGPITSNGDRIRMNMFRIDMEGGVGLDGTQQGDDPMMMLSWSDDGGRTWSNDLTRPMGKIGEYTRRAEWRRMGQFRDRIFRLRISDPVKRSITATQATFR